MHKLSSDMSFLKFLLACILPVCTWDLKMCKYLYTAWRSYKPASHLSKVNSWVTLIWKLPIEVYLVFCILKTYTCIKWQFPIYEKCQYRTAVCKSSTYLCTNFDCCDNHYAVFTMNIQVEPGTIYNSDLLRNTTFNRYSPWSGFWMVRSREVRPNGES